MTDPTAWLIGVTWPGSRPFRFAESLSALVPGRVECVGAAFPRRQPRVVKYCVVWPLFAWVSLKLLARSLTRPVRVVCWQQAYGVFLGFAWRLLEAFGLRSRSAIDVLTFIVPERKRTPRWLALLRFALSADAVKRIVVFNAAELDLYRKLFPGIAHKFAFVTYSAAEVPPPSGLRDEGFFLAVGRSNRDHAFLIDAFRGFPDRRLVVLSDQREQAASGNVKVDPNAFGPRYYEYLARCRAVVIAFHDPDISAGQLVYLQAVQYGKPVLISRSRCLDGYVVEDRTGAVFDKTPASLDAILSKAEDPDWYERVSAECLQDYSRRFGFERLAQGYVAVARSTST